MRKNNYKIPGCRVTTRPTSWSILIFLKLRPMLFELLESNHVVISWLWNLNTHTYIYMYIYIYIPAGISACAYLWLHVLWRWVWRQSSNWYPSRGRFGSQPNPTSHVPGPRQVKNARMSSWSYSLKKASKKYRTLALLRQIAAGGEIERLQSLGTSLSNAGPSMGTAGSPGETPTTQNTPKEKKKPPLQKQIGSKIAASTSKLAEIMAWESKVNEVPNMYLNFIKWFWKFIDLLIGSMLCTYIVCWNQCIIPRSKALLDGFLGELGNRKSNINSVKQELEAVYGQTLGDDKEILKRTDLVERINKSLLNAEAAFTSLTGTIRSIKTAIETWTFQLHPSTYLTVNDAMLFPRIHMLISVLLLVLSLPSRTAKDPPAAKSKAKAKAKTAPTPPADAPEPTAWSVRGVCGLFSGYGMVPLRSFFEYDNPLKNFIYYRKLWDFEKALPTRNGLQIWKKKHDTQGGSLHHWMFWQLSWTHWDCQKFQCTRIYPDISQKIETFQHEHSITPLVKMEYHYNIYVLRSRVCYPALSHDLIVKLEIKTISWFAF